MENAGTLQHQAQFRRTILIDILAIVLIVFTPALSHMLNFPLYLVEPMRIMLVIALAHTHSINAYVLAAVMPLASFLVSGHPAPPKMMLISAELILNVFLFNYLIKRFSNAFISLFASIIISKAIYYLLKFTLISAALFHGELFATPLWIQLLLSLALSTYVFLSGRKYWD